MRKLFLLATILLQGFLPHAQSISHLGFGNNYVYSESDGIDESLFYICNIGEDGKVFMHAHTGSLFIKGNNYVKKVKFPANAVPLHIGSVFEIGHRSYLAITGDSYYYFNKDSVTRVGKLITGSLRVVRYRGDIIAINKDYIFQLVEDSFICRYTTPKIKDSEVGIYTDSVYNLWQVRITKDKISFYKIINLSKPKLEFSIDNHHEEHIQDTIKVTNPVNMTLLTSKWSPFYTPADIMMNDSITTGAKYALSSPPDGYSTITNWKNKSEKHLILHADKIMNQNNYDTVTNSFYFGTYKKPFRLFPYLLKYPAIFNSSTSAGINAIVQDSAGRIWAGSYEGRLAIIDRDKVKEYQEKGLLFINGAQSTRNYVYLNTEKKGYRLVQYDLKGNGKGVALPDLFVYYTYINRKRDHLFFGTGMRTGLFITDVTSIDNGRPEWKIIDSTQGMKLKSMTTVTEDAKGRIWMGNAIRGFAVYDPETNNAQTWLIANNETASGFWSSYTDNKGTVWLGSDKNGLMYFNDYESGLVHPESIQRIIHPLLPDGSRIMQLVQWRDWLIIGTGKDMLVMDLIEWYKSKKVVIRYLNPQEANFTSRPEQNTILIDSRDSSIWFATSDMLYQWDLKRWISLPTFSVMPSLTFHKKNGDTTLAENQIIKVSPVDNTLDFSIWFQSRDNMPRYMSVTLSKKGDSVILTAPTLQTRFNYANLAPGHYQLIVQICQSDGSVSIHRFPIIIKKFWWQYWWVWFGLSLLLFLPIVFMIISRNKARLAEERAKRKDAELETLKAEQQKRLSALQIVSLSNQFRPHFILNALHTIGAELDNKPQAESVLSRLGESVDLIFNHAQQKKICHAFNDEWRLVMNVIDIHRMMYLKNLEIALPDEKIISHNKNVKVPLGLLQIPVENSLLHGLGNRDSSPWLLTITITDIQNNLLVSVIDNGVGRSKAQKLSNFSKHGTGTKNIDAILQILNKGKSDKISVTYEDGIFNDSSEPYGTKVIIQIPKAFQYDI